MIHLEIVECSDKLMLGQYNYELHHITLGRGLKNHIILNDSELSFHHATLRLSQKGLIFDCEKTFLLNGKKVSGTIIVKKEDHITIGNTVIKITNFDTEKTMDPESYFKFLEMVKEKNQGLYNLFLSLEEEYIFQMEKEANVLEE